MSHEDAQEKSDDERAKDYSEQGGIAEAGADAGQRVRERWSRFVGQLFIGFNEDCPAV
jgi:hypothetical protein